MSAHTPGPWTLQESPAGGAILIRGGGDFRKHPQTHLQIVPIEDARLIAAAPVLLEVLEALVNADAPASCCDAGTKARAAIALAKEEREA